jgi:hypothetical protein
MEVSLFQNMLLENILIIVLIDFLTHQIVEFESSFNELADMDGVE